MFLCLEIMSNHSFRGSTLPKTFGQRLFHQHYYIKSNHILCYSLPSSKSICYIQESKFMSLKIYYQSYLIRYLFNDILNRHTSISKIIFCVWNGTDYSHVLRWMIVIVTFIITAMAKNEGFVVFFLKCMQYVWWLECHLWMFQLVVFSHHCWESIIKLHTIRQYLSTKEQ